jgi:NAD(P)H dehydrogenase (quinone)
MRTKGNANQSTQLALTASCHKFSPNETQTDNEQSKTMAEAIRKSALALAHVGEFLGIDNLDPESGKIFVTGGIGSIGHRVTKRLVDAGYPMIRIGASELDLAQDLDTTGVEVSDFRWEKEETYEKALEGIKSVLITLPFENHWHLHFPTFLKACKAAKVKHMVKLSFFHARVPDDVFRGVKFVRQHAKCDELLIGMVERFNEVVFPKMSYTILYTTPCMSEPFDFQGEEVQAKSRLLGAASTHGTNFVSPNDVAEVAVRVLLEPRAHYDCEYTLTGPGPISNMFIAEHLTKYLKKPVAYVDQSIEEYELSLKQEGKPDWMIEDLVALEKAKASGGYEHFEFMTDTIEKMCDHRPETYEEYLIRTDAMTPLEIRAPGELKPLRGVMSA